jgi:pimeloyl-ACP methyl ester carboxylesterase
MAGCVLARPVRRYDDGMDDGASPTDSLARWRATAQYLTVAGQRIAWYSAGRGADAVLLIHGFPTAAWDWHRIWNPLARDFRLAAPDLLGFGDSAKPHPYRYGLDVQADICEAVAERAGFERFHVLAHDYGDTVAQELLARHREGSPALSGLRSVLFLNGGLFPEAHRPRRIQVLLAGPLGPALARLMGRRQIGRGLAAVFGPDTQPTPGELDALIDLVEAGNGRRVMPTLLGYMKERSARRDRWVGGLETARVPIMLVDGEADPVSGGHLADRWAELLPDRPLRRLPGIGHWPQLEDPAAVLEAARSLFSAA